MAMDAGQIKALIKVPFATLPGTAITTPPRSFRSRSAARTGSSNTKWSTTP